MANSTKIGTGKTNLVLETAGRVYIKVQDRFYELDFRNKQAKEIVKEEITIPSETIPEIDLSSYVNSEDLLIILNNYVKTKDLPDYSTDFENLENTLNQLKRKIKLIENSINTIGDTYFQWDSDYSAVFTEYPLYSESWISAGGKDIDTEEDIFKVITSWNDSNAELTDVPGYSLVNTFYNETKNKFTELEELIADSGDKVTVSPESFTESILIATITVDSKDTARNKTYSIKAPGGLDKYVKYDDNGDVTLTRHLYVNGDIRGVLNPSLLSDRELKTNFTTLTAEESLKVIMELNPGSFTWKHIATELSPSRNGVSQGFIAQEYERIIPNSSSKIGNYLGIDYLRTIPYTVRLLQDHEGRLKKLEELHGLRE